MRMCVQMLITDYCPKNSINQYSISIIYILYVYKYHNNNLLVDFFSSQDIFLANQTEIIQEKRNKEKPTEI